MCTNSFTMSAIALELLHPIQRERCAFQRNERWFEDTLPRFGDAHFRQSLRVTPATFRYGMIPLALVDHQYRFRYINVGSPGRCRDASVYCRSDYCKLVESDFSPTPVSIIEGTTMAPVIRCDHAFSLTANLQKPSANAVTDTHERLYNYHLSRTRRIVENAFGKAPFRYTSKRMECRLQQLNRPSELHVCYTTSARPSRTPLNTNGSKSCMSSTRSILSQPTALMCPVVMVNV
ncbi:hypothetical protein MTO96_033944 [Rhipicephalus appendiculatus]